ncbi:MAG TPA: IS1634 family transposase, partial [Steroidobacteraceae bacterium]|nr:IS1634 family transposase [Steroidobacteraceae bacterium]
MFLRRCERSKNGKTHTYWALVESIRTAKGSRQKVVAYLGELKPSEQSGWAQLGQRLPDAHKPQPSLFDPPHHDDPVAEEDQVLVRLKDIRLERLRDFGDVWLAWGLWRLLGMDTLLTQLLPAGREEVPWPTVAAILTLARFCAPASERHIENVWYRRTALEDLLGVPVAAVHTDRLYAGLDRLLPHKEALEKHLKERLGNLFDLKFDLFLYDITSTYFEGECQANAMAKRGYSRDSRPDCPQVLIALVVTDDGIPLGYEVFDGNRNDATTVQEIVAAMEKKYGCVQHVWVMDRGMVSAKNLAYLRERGDAYIVGTPKALLKQFAQHLTERDWHAVQAGVEVKLVSGPDGSETFVLARSADRRAKEKAMHGRFRDRLEQKLQRLQAAAVQGRLRDAGVAHQRLGRLLERNWRASGAFDVTIELLPQPEGKARLRITWKRNDRWSEWQELSEGCYLLRTNLTETDPAVLWKRYIQLTEAEWAFRITKEELRLRPIWHQKADRVKAHILVCFLAYVLWKALAQWMRRASLGDAPRTLVAELATIKSGDVVLPAASRAGRVRTVRLRCVTEPDPAQKVLLTRLGLKLPRRLRR